MGAPKYIQEKAEQLAKALDRVAELSQELEEWYGKNAGYEYASDFFHDQHLDSPWEYDLNDTLNVLDEAADND